MIELRAVYRYTDMGNFVWFKPRAMPYALFKFQNKYLEWDSLYLSCGVEYRCEAMEVIDD